MIRKFLVVTILFVTSSCLPLIPPPAPLSAPATVPSPISTPLSPALPTSSRAQTVEPITAVQRAIEDLAARLTIEPDVIQVVSVADDDFPVDGWLGCGKIKSEVVRPAFVTGQSIRLRAQNIIYEYRAHGGQLVFCDASQ